ncbi:HTH-like domain-containing protein [Polaribacter sp.]|uniref:HTH-like domain-containing protein n=1 Tax=Polaribacter sp. TaxID=1920175 RepID=UPI003EF2FC8F
MTINELGSTLNDMYHNASKGEAVAMIHLFGIKYASEIKQCGFNKKEIAKAANVPESFATEISKGMKLSQFVTIKDNI